MATAGEAVRPLIRPRTIIERPRLIRMLDEANARLRLLIGAAGYGKTTLAEQWAAHPGRRVGWVRCRRSSSDIAVISRLVAAAGATVIPDCNRRLEQRLSVTPDPSREVDVLGEILAEDLASWPADAWIVIDDYHFAMEAIAAERFVEVVASRSPVQLLIASRSRPSWVSSRDLVYEHVAEIDQPCLTMSREEADEVLAGASGQERDQVIGVADGWPAVIGLAGTGGFGTAIPEALLSFFAEEVLGGIKPRLKQILIVLAVLPHVDDALLEFILDEGDHRDLLASGVAAGLIEERQEGLALHPLAAAFFTSREKDASTAEVHNLISAAFAWYMANAEWDAAFEVVRRHGHAADLALLIETSLDAMVNSARLATLELWTKPTVNGPPDSAYILLARSEVALRHGRHRSAQTLAERALHGASEGDHALRVRAMLVSGRAAHAGSRELEAFAHFRAALKSASDDESQLAALHGVVMSAAALEHADAPSYLGQLDSRTTRSDPHQAVRLVDRQLSLGLRFGTIPDLAEARSVSELLPEVVDPLARCSFRSMFSCALVLGAQYEEAREQAAALCEEASEYRLRLVFPYGFATAAAASAGLHEFDSAHAFLDAATAASRECHDEYGAQNVFAIRTRVLLQEGRIVEACALEPPELTGAIPSMRGEVLASRALALACIGRFEAARSLAMLARESTRAIEAKSLSRAVQTVIALRAREPNYLSTLVDLVTTAFNSGAVDPVVTAYRACPDILSSILSFEATREFGVFLLARAGDDGLASSDGSRPSERLRPLESLTPREREVCDLACHGLSNQDIARALFIAESTVKVHLHKIYDKVGVRSRGALALIVSQSGM